MRRLRDLGGFGGSGCILVLLGVRVISVIGKLRVYFGIFGELGVLFFLCDGGEGRGIGEVFGVLFWSYINIKLVFI